MTPPDLLNRELRRAGARPLITYYDATGGRVELSVATTANWVAKASGYLVDGLGVEPGETVAVEPVPHWQTAVGLLAVWSVGAQVADPGTTPLSLALPLDAMGARLSALVAAYPDEYRPSEPSGADLVAVAASVELPAQARVMTSLPLSGDGLSAGLLAPLSVGGSVVYVADGRDAEGRARAERATHTAGLDVPGLPRLG